MQAGGLFPAMRSMTVIVAWKTALQKACSSQLRCHVRGAKTAHDNVCFQWLPELDG